MPSTKRTQLQRVHMTSECVRALVGEEADAAEEVAVRDARRDDDHLARREVLGREDVVDVLDPELARVARSRARVVGQSCACSSPPRQRSAAAGSTAWRVPPMPIARWSFVPRIAAEIDAVTSPSWISLIRAPAARISSIRSWWRGRSRTIVVMSLTFRPKASAIARTFSATGSARSMSPARARADGHLAHVHVAAARRASRAVADGDHRHRAVAAARDDAAALERIEREVDLLAARADRSADRELVGALGRADDDVAVDRQLLEREPRIPEEAASSAASWSARPSQRAPASAARSVARA